jgi:hypothetical protein
MEAAAAIAAAKAMKVVTVGRLRAVHSEHGLRPWQVKGWVRLEQYEVCEWIIRVEERFDNRTEQAEILYKIQRGYRNYRLTILLDDVE